MNRPAPLELRPFGEGDIASAVALLEQRHARHRQAEPLLPAADAHAAVAGLWRRPDTTGAVARRGGRAVGYLIGLSASRP